MPPLQSVSAITAEPIRPQTHQRTAAPEILPPQRTAVRHARQSLPRSVLLLATGGLIAAGGQTFYGSYQRWALHSAPVHHDASVIDAGAPRQLTGYDVALAVRDQGGHVRHVLANKSEATVFVNQTLAFLDAEEAKVRAELVREIAALIDAAFADRTRAIDEFADWNFAYGRSWRILYESVSAAVAHIPKALVSKETIQEAVRHEVEAYFLRHYKQFVLKPEIRDPVLGRGIEAALRRAHASYVRVVANVDLRLQLYLARSTQLLDAGTATQLRTLNLDWDAQAFKAPRYGLEDQAMNAVFRGTKVAGISALIAHTVGPAVEAQLVAVFSAVAGRVLPALAPELTATLAGTTLGGPWGGYATGLVFSVWADMFMTSQAEKFERPQFIAANTQAVEATMATWNSTLGTRATAALGVWFADTRALVATKQLQLTQDHTQRRGL